jgi:hypothetical protein
MPGRPLIDHAGLLPPSSSVTGVKMLGRRPHDDAADVCATGVEDVIEALLEQLGGLLDRSLDHPNGTSVEIRGISSAISAEVAAAISEGLITAQLPAASAGISGLSTSCTG